MEVEGAGSGRLTEVLQHIAAHKLAPREASRLLSLFRAFGSTSRSNSSSSKEKQPEGVTAGGSTAAFCLSTTDIFRLDFVKAAQNGSFVCPSQRQEQRLIVGERKGRRRREESRGVVENLARRKINQIRERQE